MERAMLILKATPAKVHFVSVISSYSKGGVITKVVRFDDGTTETYIKDQIAEFKYQMS